jgi:hypothetical protein
MKKGIRAKAIRPTQTADPGAFLSSRSAGAIAVPWATEIVGNLLSIMIARKLYGSLPWAKGGRNVHVVRFLEQTEHFLVVFFQK